MYVLGGDQHKLAKISSDTDYFLSGRAVKHRLAKISSVDTDCGGVQHMSAKMSTPETHWGGSPSEGKSCEKYKLSSVYTWFTEFFPFYI